MGGWMILCVHKLKLLWHDCAYNVFNAPLAPMCWCSLRFLLWGFMAERCQGHHWLGLLGLSREVLWLQQVRLRAQEDGLSSCISNLAPPLSSQSSCSALLMKRNYLAELTGDSQDGDLQGNNHTVPVCGEQLTAVCFRLSELFKVSYLDGFQLKSTTSPCSDDISSCT